MPRVRVLERLSASDLFLLMWADYGWCSDIGARFQVERSGSPTVGSAPMRILAAIPSIIVLALLVYVGAIVWVIAAVLVLADGHYPPLTLELRPLSPAAPWS